MKKTSVVVFLALTTLPFAAFAQEDGLTVAAGYRSSAVLNNLPEIFSFTFDFEGNFILLKKANNAFQIVKVDPGGQETVLLQRSTEPIIGLSFYEGKVYVALRGSVAILSKGHLNDIIAGLPAYGDYSNSNVIFQDGKMYFSVGTATNSGIVGADNAWLTGQPYIHDLLCDNTKINQVNVQTDNFLTKKKDDVTSIGSFQPFNTPTFSDTTSSSLKCNGSIMRANPDGSNLEVYAWGFHNPKGLGFDEKGNLFTLDQAMEDRGLRPVKNGKDSLFAVSQHLWYGWPDFNAGEALNNRLIKDFPNPAPMPIGTFEPNHLSDFVVSDFEPNQGLAINDGQKISELSLNSDSIKDMILSADNVTQIKFGPDKNLYVLTDNGKNSTLYKVESTNPAVASSTKNPTAKISFNWLMSISITVLGILAAYFVTRSAQKPV